MEMDHSFHSRLFSLLAFLDEQQWLLHSSPISYEIAVTRETKLLEKKINIK